MATKLTSPLQIADVNKAYAAYCNLPVFKRADRTPKSKAEFKKDHKAAAATRNGAVVAEAKGDSPLDIAQIVAEATAAALAAAGISTDEPVVESKGEFRSRTPREQIPADAARNAVLWALNTEGFLVLDTSGGNDPITQEDGTTLLSETFGPLT